MSAPLLALLQLSDSGFPSGSFAHSYGLEQALNQRLVTGAEEVEAFVRSVITQSAATADARACYAAGEGDITTAIETDEALFRTKAAAELRDACVATGRRLIEETVLHIEHADLRTYADAVASGEAPGCHPVAFGVVSRALGVDPGDAAVALLASTANALLQAAMRLGRISHRDAQAVLHRLRPLIADLDLSDRSLCSCHPLQEIASMRHQRAEARLFAS